MRLQDAVSDLQYALEDIDEAFWDKDEIGDNLIEAYDHFTRDTKCLWDMTYAENVPAVGSGTNIVDETFFTSGYIYNGTFTFTGGEWERDYSDGGTGPVMTTNTWEGYYEYAATWEAYASVVQLPDTTIEVDRVTFDGYAISPHMSQTLERNSGNYETVLGGGSHYGYLLDKDGTFGFRKLPVPSTTGTEHSTSGTFGLLRIGNDNEFSDDATVIGTFGIMRACDEHFPAREQQFGFPRRVHEDGTNFRIEVFRRGVPLTDNGHFEVPDRYVRYIKCYAIALCREKDGPGQNTELAKHFYARYEQGVKRCNDRKQSVVDRRVGRLGGAAPYGRQFRFARLPWHYGRQG